MSLLPIMLRSMGWQLRQHNELMRHFLRQDMKGFFTPEEIKFLTNPFPTIGCIRGDNNNNNNNVVMSTPETETVMNNDEYKLSVDVQQFEPDEVKVKTVGNMVIVEGKHEERPDENGIISRQFVRKYTIPEGYNIKDLVSTLSADGILTVKAPSLETLEGKNERVVKIEQTGETLRKIKEEKSNEKQQTITDEK